MFVYPTVMKIDRDISGDAQYGSYDNSDSARADGDWLCGEQRNGARSGKKASAESGDAAVRSPTREWNRIMSAAEVRCGWLTGAFGIARPAGRSRQASIICISRSTRRGGLGPAADATGINCCDCRRRQGETKVYSLAMLVPAR